MAGASFGAAACEAISGLAGYVLGLKREVDMVNLLKTRGGLVDRPAL